ncbi:MAG TPA: Holliday junction DNA helicase RuvB C-terminal domain-containing protein, partial [Candidatus Paceibacterota bacterium]
ILGVKIDKAAIDELAKRSRFTPRVANQLLKRARDYAQVHKRELNRETVKEALDLLAVDELGLSSGDRKILSVIIEKFGGGPVGVSTIAAATSEEPATIEEVHEPYLLQIGLIERTPRGRIATEAAYKIVGLPYSGERRLL